MRAIRVSATHSFPQVRSTARAEASGGSSGGVKCLHAHYADFAAGNDNPIGRDLHDAIGEPRCQAPCVAIVDGELQRNSQWRESTDDDDPR